MKTSKINCLITGVTGMVGSHLVDYLLENTDWNIYGMCRWRSPQDNVQHLLERANNKDRVFFIYGDITDPLSMSHVIESTLPDYVFHLAAQSYPRTSFEAPLDTYTTNVHGTSILLEVLRKEKSIDPEIHVCASSEVYGRVAKEKLPIDEECSFHPASPYAISKVGTDLIGRYHAEAYGQKVQVTRMFTHTGPRRGDVFAESSFAKQIAMIEAGLIEPFVQVGNLNSLRTWSDVRDAVRAYYLLLTKNPQLGAYYNIGGDCTKTIREMLEKLISLSSLSDEIKIIEDSERLRPIDADLQVPNTNKFTNHTGWNPEIKFEQTMHDLLDYWRGRINSGERFLRR